MKNIHLTTMKPKQRKELIRILSMGMFGHTFETLANLTDTQLHKQWLAECRYIPITEAPIPIKDEE